MHTRLPIQRISSDSLNKLKDLFVSAMSVSRRLSLYYRPARPQHQLFQARYAFLTESSPTSRVALVRVRLVNAIMEARQMAMIYEEGMGRMYLGACGSLHVVEACGHLESAKEIFRETMSPREMHQVALLWEKIDGQGEYHS